MPRLRTPYPRPRPRPKTCPILARLLHSFPAQSSAERSSGVPVGRLQSPLSRRPRLQAHLFEDPAKRAPRPWTCLRWKALTAGPLQAATQREEQAGDLGDPPCPLAAGKPQHVGARQEPLSSLTKPSWLCAGVPAEVAARACAHCSQTCGVNIPTSRARRRLESLIFCLRTAWPRGMLNTWMPGCLEAPLCAQPSAVAVAAAEVTFCRQENSVEERELFLWPSDPSTARKS